MDSLFMNVSTAAKMLGVNIETMYSIIQLNNFPVLKIPRKERTLYRINKEGFNKWIETNSM